MTNIKPNPSNIQPFPSSHSLPFVPLVCAFARWAASHTHTASVRSLIFHALPCAGTAYPEAEKIHADQPAPTSLGVRNADVNGRDGRVGVVAVVLDEEGVLLPGLLYHRHWSNGRRRSSVRYNARAYMLWILDLKRFHTMPAESLVGLICLMWMQWSETVQLNYGYFTLVFICS